MSSDLLRFEAMPLQTAHSSDSPRNENKKATTAGRMEHDSGMLNCLQSGSQDRRSASWRKDSGVTLIELIIVTTIIAILATAAVPLARFQVKRQKERELRRDLWTMRDAIDHYYDAALKGGIQTKADSFNYPPDLETLVDGVDVQTKKVKFLRAIPTDPMTNSKEWSLRSMQDDADSDSWGGQNVFDVHTKSTGTALDGTKYNTW